VRRIRRLIPLRAHRIVLPQTRQWSRKWIRTILPHQIVSEVFRGTAGLRCSVAETMFGLRYFWPLPRLLRILCIMGGCKAFLTWYHSLFNCLMGTARGGIRFGIPLITSSFKYFSLLLHLRFRTWTIIDLAQFSSRK
jgi:hypothetical protein